MIADPTTLGSNERRPDAWEKKANLSEVQIWQAFGWGRSLGYQKARALVAKEFNIAAPSLAAFAKFYQTYAREEQANRIHKSCTDAAAIRASVSDQGELTEAMAAALEAEASSAILAGDDADRLKLLVSLALKARGSLRSEKTLELEVRKYQDAVKSNIERGLDALADEIKDHPEATALYSRIREIVIASMPPARST
jgi:hypothetical protein